MSIEQGGVSPWPALSGWDIRRSGLQHARGLLAGNRHARMGIVDFATAHAGRSPRKGDSESVSTKAPTASLKRSVFRRMNTAESLTLFPSTSANIACIRRQCAPSQNTRRQTSQAAKRSCCSRSLSGKWSSTSALAMCRSDVLHVRSRRWTISLSCRSGLKASTYQPCVTSRRLSSSTSRVRSMRPSLIAMLTISSSWK